MFYYGDMYYIILVLPAILLALYAQNKVQSTFKKYANCGNAKAVTGCEAAQQVLNDQGIFDVAVERVSGELTDHYDPKANVIRLSDAVYNSTSISAIGVAAHEAGHAVQYHKGYSPIKIRNSLLPFAQLGTYASIIISLFGFFLSATFLWFGIYLFTGVVIFQLVTLPVEYNASKRAIEALKQGSILGDEELIGAKKVLNAAALTYVAAVAVSFANLLRFILIAKRNEN